MSGRRWRTCVDCGTRCRGVRCRTCDNRHRATCVAVAEQPPQWSPPGPWVDEALCAQINPEEFFPPKGGSVRAAKAVCARCPVVAECLSYALEHNEAFGVWGGKSERERRRLRRGEEAA